VAKKAVAVAPQPKPGRFTDKQVQASDLMRGENRHTQLEGGSRCVASWTILDGQDKTIKELAEIGKPVRVITSRGTQVAEAPFLKGYCRMLEVTLASGRRITVTPDHRFWSQSGWVQAQRLLPGVGVAVLPEGRIERLSDVLLLAWWRLTGKSRDNPAPGGYAMDRVVSVIGAAELPYYTLHVPVTEQYFANGILNHNSGKTAVIVRNIINRALFNAGSRHVSLRLHRVNAWESLWLDTIPKVMDLFFPGLRATVKLNLQFGYMTFPNGAEYWVGGLDDKDRVDKVLGREFSTIHINESSQISYQSVLTVRTRLVQRVVGRKGLCGQCKDHSTHVTPEGIISSCYLKNREFHDLNPIGRGHWSYKEFHLNVDPLSPEKKLNPADYAWLKMNPVDNLQNIDPDYLAMLDRMPARMRARFRDGDYQDELPGALWTSMVLDRCLGDVCGGTNDFPVPMRRIVVGVDPSGASGAIGEKADNIGIVVCGMGEDNRAYVLEDASMTGSPEKWASMVNDMWLKWGADLVVAERNYGGEMVRSTLHHANPHMRVDLVTSSRGKILRADPVSLLYENQPTRVIHCGVFQTLEEEMCSIRSGDTAEDVRKRLGRSPGSLDACVFALTELFGLNRSMGLIELMKKMAENPVVQGQIGDNELAKKIMGKVVGSQMTKPAVGDETLACPACTSVSVSRMQQGWRCSQCAHVWGNLILPPGMPKRGDVAKTW
jgi:hypothetical protein